MSQQPTLWEQPSQEPVPPANPSLFSPGDRVQHKKLKVVLWIAEVSADASYVSLAGRPGGSAGVRQIPTSDLERVAESEENK